MSICLSRLCDTRIEEDSENSTISKDLFVRNVFSLLHLFLVSYFPSLNPYEMSTITTLIEPLSKGRRKRGCQRPWRTLNGWTKSTYSGQRLESHTNARLCRLLPEGRKNFDGEGSPRNQLSPLPKIGEGFREWSEAPSYEEGVGDDGGAEGLPSDGVWGYPPARDVSRCVSMAMVP